LFTREIEKFGFEKVAVEDCPSPIFTRKPRPESLYSSPHETESLRRRWR
jgi:hypothetical protein